MNYSLGNMLGNGMLGGLDADAKAYIAAVTATGTSVSGTQKASINNFYVSAKSDGYYTSLKRLYLPIWANAAANAIDMIGLTSGTFVGGVTHAAGYVQSNGTTGYFDMGISPTTLGLTTSSSGLGSLVYVADTIPTDTAFYISSRELFNNGEVSLYQSSSVVNSILSRGPSTVVSNYNITPKNGVLLARRNSVTSMFIAQRNNVGYTESVEQTTTVSGNAISTLNIWAMALNNNSAIGLPTDAQLGSYFVFTGMSLTQSTDFTLALKDIWETTTGNVLP